MQKIYKISKSKGYPVSLPQLFFFFLILLTWIPASNDDQDIWTSDAVTSKGAEHIASSITERINLEYKMST